VENLWRIKPGKALDGRGTRTKQNLLLERSGITLYMGVLSPKHESKIAAWKQWRQGT